MWHPSCAARGAWAPLHPHRCIRTDACAPMHAGQAACCGQLAVALWAQPWKKASVPRTGPTGISYRTCLPLSVASVGVRSGWPAAFTAMLKACTLPAAAAEAVAGQAAAATSSSARRAAIVRLQRLHSLVIPAGAAALPNPSWGLCPRLNRVRRTGRVAPSRLLKDGLKASAQGKAAAMNYCADALAGFGQGSKRLGRSHKAS